jgi:hypothetical protein
VVQYWQPIPYTPQVGGASRIRGVGDDGKAGLAVMTMMPLLLLLLLMMITMIMIMMMMKEAWAVVLRILVVMT